MASQIIDGYIRDTASQIIDGYIWDTARQIIDGYIRDTAMTHISLPIQVQYSRYPDNGVICTALNHGL